MNRPTVPDSVSDSDWVLNKSTSITHRGILDFDRTVTFPLPLTEEQLEGVCRWLETHQCPGWTGVSVHRAYTAKCDAGTYVFSTTHDSSD